MIQECLSIDEKEDSEFQKGVDRARAVFEENHSICEYFDAIVRLNLTFCPNTRELRSAQDPVVRY